MKALARRMLLVLALVGALGGCGRQDRYEIVEPPVQNEAQEDSWASLTQIHVPSVNNSGIQALAAWSVDDYLMSLGWGEVYRVQGDHYLRQDWPGTGWVVGLVIRPDGSVWGLDRAGQLCTLQGTTWNLESDLLDGEGFRGLLEDHQGRLIAYGESGLLWRETETGWESIPADPQQSFVDAWASPGQGTFLVTSELEVFQLGENEAELLVRLAQEGWSSLYRIEGDGTGRLAVSDPNGPHLWVMDGGQWSLIDEDLRILDIFWLEGELHGVLNSPHQIIRWEPEGWQTVAEFPDYFRSSDLRTCTLDGGRFIGCGEAGVLNLDSGQLDAVSPPLGYVAGLIDYQGRTHALFEEGTHLINTESGWQLLGQPLLGTSPLEPATLKIDQAGRLIFLGQSKISTWDGSNYQTFEQEGSPWSKAYYQPDGSFFLMGYSGEWTLFVDGVFGEISHYQEDWDDLRGVVLGDDGSGWVAEDSRLGRLNRGQIQTELLAQNWRIYGLVNDPARGTIVHGSGRVLALADQGYEDISPRIPGDDDPQGASIYYLFPDTQGGLVGWDIEHDLLLLHDGTNWKYQDVPGVSSWWHSARLNANSDGTFYLWERDSSFFHIERAAGP